MKIPLIGGTLGTTRFPPGLQFQYETRLGNFSGSFLGGSMTVVRSTSTHEDFLEAEIYSVAGKSLDIELHVSSKGVWTRLESFKRGFQLSLSTAPRFPSIKSVSSIDLESLRQSVSSTVTTQAARLKEMLETGLDE